MQGSTYVPQRQDVSVAVKQSSESLFKLYPAESTNGEGVPNGSMSITSNLPMFDLSSLLASF